MNSELSTQKLIRVSSDDRDISLYPNTNRFSVKFDNVDALQRVYAVVVKHVSFTNTFYNMKFPETIEYKYQGTTYVHVIPYDVQWTIYELLDWVNGQGSWPTSHNWTYDPTLNKVLVIADATHTLQILGGVVSEKLGLEPQSTVKTSNFYGQNQINLSGTQHVFIYSKTLAQGKNMIKGRDLQEVPALLMVPCDVAFGAVKHYETQHDNLDVVNFDDQINLQKIDIEIRDGKGELLDTSKHHVSLVLKILYA